MLKCIYNTYIHTYIHYILNVYICYICIYIKCLNSPGIKNTHFCSVASSIIYRRQNKLSALKMVTTTERVNS